MGVMINAYKITVHKPEEYGSMMLEWILQK